MMDELLKSYTETLEKRLSKMLPCHSALKQAIPYSVFPAGKLFRPLLCLHIAKDLNQKINDDVYSLAHFCELHHAYSLVHDDLPAMDNDDYRRGRLSTHKKFTEATAILSGDALINLSYETLTSITSEKLPKILKLCSWATGPKGLILGQELDLTNNDKSLSDIILIHKLKTSRLIQISFAGTSLLSQGSNYRRFVDFMKMGEALGIAFQLLDDLGELSEELSEHEKEINPFLKFSPEEVFQIIKRQKTKLFTLIKKYELTHTHQFVDKFFDKSLQKILSNKDKIEEVLKSKIDL